MQGALGSIPSTRSEAQGHLWLHREFDASLGQRLSQKREEKTVLRKPGVVIESQHIQGRSGRIGANLSYRLSPWPS